MKREARRLRYVLATVVLTLILLGCGVSSPGAGYRLPPPQGVQELPDFPPVQRWRLPNGLEIRFLPDQELPMIAGTLFVRGGTLWESDDKRSVVSAMGEQMRLGGAGDLGADDLDRRLEELSASISSSFGQEFGKISFSSLASDFDEVMSLVSDIALRPRFEEARLTLWKAQALETIRRRKDNPGTVGSLSYTQLLFHGSPYGKVAVSEDVNAVTRLEMVKAHRRWLQAGRALLAITGDITRAEAEAAVAKYFGGWESGSDVSPLVPPPAPETPYEKTIVFIEQPLEQATILFGQQGVPRLTEDQFAIEAFNNIFGAGGFGSRLMKKVRSDLGLAYVVYGGISPGLVKGKNVIFIQTKTESAVSALEASLKVLSELAVDPVPPNELEETRETLEHAFVFNFASPAQRLFRLVQLELLGYPEDYDEQYLAAIEGLTAKDVMEVAASRWSIPDGVGVVVGDAKLLPALEQWINSAASPLAGYTLKRGEFIEALRNY